MKFLRDHVSLRFRRLLRFAPSDVRRFSGHDPTLYVRFTAAIARNWFKRDIEVAEPISIFTRTRAGRVAGRLSQLSAMRLLSLFSTNWLSKFRV